MTDVATNNRYNALSIALHWLMVLLFVAVYAAIELRELFPKGSDPREALKSLHFTLGLSIFALAWVRIAARIVSSPPVGGGSSQRLIAGVVHAGLYFLMIGMPLAGWLILSAEGKPVSYFGVHLPPLTGVNGGLAERVEDMHRLVGTIGYWLIGIHALAAIIHHYVLRDGLLARMIPSRRRKRPA